MVCEKKLNFSVLMADFRLGLEELKTVLLELLYTSPDFRKAVKKMIFSDGELLTASTPSVTTKVPDAPKRRESAGAVDSSHHIAPLNVAQATAGEPMRHKKSRSEGGDKLDEMIREEKAKTKEPSQSAPISPVNAIAVTEPAPRSAREKDTLAITTADKTSEEDPEKEKEKPKEKMRKDKSKAKDKEKSPDTPSPEKQFTSTPFEAVSTSSARRATKKQRSVASIPRPNKDKEKSPDAPVDFDGLKKSRRKERQTVNLGGPPQF